MFRSMPKDRKSSLKLAPAVSTCVGRLVDAMLSQLVTSEASASEVGRPSGDSEYASNS